MATVPQLLAQLREYHRTGAMAQVDRMARQILRADPRNVEASHLLANSLHARGKLAEAAKQYQEVLRLDPACATAANDLGVALAMQGRMDEAVAAFRDAVRLKPDYAAAHNNLGNALRNRGGLDEAVTHFREAIRLKPPLADAHSNLGLALLAQGLGGPAISAFQRAVHLKPKDAEAHHNLGLALQSQGQLKEAIASFQQALRVRSNFAEAHCNLGNAFRDHGKPDEALASYQEAVRLRPNFAIALANAGAVLADLDQLQAAIASCQKALQLDPTLAEAHLNLGQVNTRLGQLDEALTSYQEALRLKPDLAEAHKNRGHLYLLRGDFAHGWPEFEWRWQTRDIRRHALHQPRWHGEPLEGKTILLAAEQGLGDTIQFVRYAPLVQQRGGRVIVRCQPPLLQLLRDAPGIDHVIDEGSPLPSFDVQAPLLSLPGILGTTLASIPAKTPYLEADAPFVERWRQELQPLCGFKVGIAWQGNPKYRGDRHRSIPLVSFAPLAAERGVQLVSLQKGFGTEQLRDLSSQFPIVTLGDLLNQSSSSLMDTAAIVQSLDLVVTSDTMIAHLAGALGVPVWVALPLMPDWRWLLHREDSPWYPTMRLFRQEKAGDWESVFHRIAQALHERLAL
jgi:tetratricopeptide (TPR) repeat protein